MCIMSDWLKQHKRVSEQALGVGYFIILNMVDGEDHHLYTHIIHRSMTFQGLTGTLVPRGLIAYNANN